MNWNKYLYFGLHSFVEYLLIVTPEIIFDRENRIWKQNQKPAHVMSAICNFICHIFFYKQVVWLSSFKINIHASGIYTISLLKKKKYPCLDYLIFLSAVYTCHMTQFNLLYFNVLFFIILNSEHFLCTQTQSQKLSSV